LAIADKSKQTLSRIEALADDEIWRMNPARGANLISYIVAGYTSDPNPQVYEVSAELNFLQQKIEYHPPFQCRNNPLFLGACRHVRRAVTISSSAEWAFWQSYGSSEQAGAAVQNLQ